MSDLPPLLTDALAAIGPETAARMEDLIDDFVSLPLSEEDRLSALAGAIATIATTRYRQHRPIFIAALRSWALDIAIGLAPARSCLSDERRGGRVREAQDGLLGGIDTILRSMVANGSAKHHRLVTELAVMARLLGRCDAHRVHLVLTAAIRACENPVWESGSAVPVSLDEARLPLTREVSIEAIAPRGTA